MQCNDITVLNGYARSMSVDMNHKLKKKILEAAENDTPRYKALSNTFVKFPRISTDNKTS